MKRSAALLPLISACGGPPADKADDRIECALEGAAGFQRVCTVERSSGPGFTFVIRGPSGGFRRFTATGDGRGLVAADGAEPARVTIIADDRIEVAIGGDVFRLPATVRGP